MKSNFTDFFIVKLFIIRIFFWWFRRVILEEMDGLLIYQMLFQFELC